MSISESFSSSVCFILSLRVLFLPIYTVLRMLHWCLFEDTLDVYVDKKSQVWLIDVNPFGNPSCALLFEWNEFPILKQENESFAAILCTSRSDAASSEIGVGARQAAAATDVTQPGAGTTTVTVNATTATPQPEFRYVRNKSEVLQSSAGTNRGPVDVHMSQDFPKFMELAKKQSAMDDDSCDEDETR